MEINLIVIRSTKPKELSKFYEQIGMEFVYHQHGNGTWHYSAEVNNTIFEIYPLLKNQQNPDNSLRLGFTIENLDTTVKAMKEQGVIVTREPNHSEWGYFAVVKDLDGRKIELKEEPAGSS